jgi:hypothetical protein
MSYKNGSFLLTFRALYPAGSYLQHAGDYIRNRDPNASPGVDLPVEIPTTTTRAIRM